MDPRSKPKSEKSKKDEKPKSQNLEVLTEPPFKRERAEYDYVLETEKQKKREKLKKTAFRKRLREPLNTLE